jgi:D-alanine transaminase
MTYCYLNGKFLNKNTAKLHISDEGFLYGYGIYEAIYIVGNKAWNFKAHLNRLISSAKAIHLKTPNPEVIEKIVYKLIKKNSLSESKLRIDITPQTFLITQEKYKRPQKLGKLILIKTERPLPNIKSTSLITSVLARQKALKAKADEALFLIDNNLVAEGATSNIFIVKNNTVITTKKHALSGTTQAKVLQIAKKLKIKTKLQNISLKQLKNADEVFITSALKLIMPIIKIDNKSVKNARIGSLTKKLKNAFEKELNEFIQKD